MIKDIMNKISIETHSEAVEELERIGVSVMDSEGNMKGLWDILQEVSYIAERNAGVFK